MLFKKSSSFKWLKNYFPVSSPLDNSFDNVCYPINCLTTWFQIDFFLNGLRDIYSIAGYWHD